MYRDLKNIFDTGSIVIKFIFINVAVFLIINLFLLLGFLFKTDIFNPLPWLAAHSSAAVMLVKPWTAFTYMFTHEGFFHLLFNMVMLYFMGNIYFQMLNERRFISTYILGGLAGFILYFLAFNLLPVFRSDTGFPIIGASAAVLAILAGIATYVPNMRVNLVLIGPVQLKYIAIFFIVLDFLQVRHANAGGHIAHIGGALFGYISSKQLQKGNDFSVWVTKISRFFKNLFRRRSRLKVVKQKPGYKAQYYNTSSREEKVTQMKIDAILDKISRSGYDSLSKEEKEILFKASKK